MDPDLQREVVSCLLPCLFWLRSLTDDLPSSLLRHNRYDLGRTAHRSPGALGGPVACIPNIADITDGSVAAKFVPDADSVAIVLGQTLLN